MSRKDSEQQPAGPQRHAEGQHGDKAHAAFLDELHKNDRAAADSDPSDPAPHKRDFDEFGVARPGHHRLQEDREQHDEAEKNSEHNRERR